MNKNVLLLMLLAMVVSLLRAAIYIVTFKKTAISMVHPCTSFMAMYRHICFADRVDKQGMCG